MYGLASPGDDNIFEWLHRPDVNRVAELMTRYIPEWDYRVVSRKGQDGRLEGWRVGRE